MRKTWHQKLESGSASHIEVTTKAFAGIPVGVKMLISSPKEVRDFVRRLPAGSQLDVAKVREELAKGHGADVSCPLTCSIFLRIVSEAALDELESGTPLCEITPFWRAISPKDKVAQKIRCGPDFIASQRNTERAVH